MNQSSDAAEQVIRLSLQGFEVAVRLSGSGAKNFAALLVAIAKDKQNCLLTIPFENPNAPGINISSVPGNRNLNGTTRMHQGMDIGTKGNEDLRIVAPAAGKVHLTTTTYSGGGRVVISHHPLSQTNSMWRSDCQYYETRFLHLYRILVSGGQALSQGTPIGIVGGSNYTGGRFYEANNASYSTAADKAHGYAIHMHYEVRSCKNNIINPLSDQAQNLCNDVQQEVVNPEDIPLSPEIKAEIEAQKEAAQKGININAGKTGSYEHAAAASSSENGEVVVGKTCKMENHDEFFESCVFCDMFKVLFNAASGLARYAHDIFAKSMLPLLGVGLALSLAWMIMRYVSDMRQQYFGKMFNDIFKQTIDFFVKNENVYLD